MFKMGSLVAAVAAFLSMVGPASAATITCTATSNNSYCSGPNNTIGTAGIDLYFGVISPIFNGPFLSFDFIGNTLVIESLSNVTFGSSGTITFVSSDPFTAAVLVSNNAQNFSASNLTLTSAGALTINIAGTQFRRGQTVTIGLAAPTGVPEPSSWAVLLLGFAIVGYGMRQGHMRRTAVLA